MPVVVGGIYPYSGEIVPGHFYAGLCFTKSPMDQLPAKLTIEWLDPTGSTPVGTAISSGWRTPAASVGASCSLLLVAGAAPAGAGQASLVVSSDASGGASPTLFCRFSLVPVDGAAAPNLCYDSGFLDAESDVLASWSVPDFWTRKGGILSIPGNGVAFADEPIIGLPVPLDPGTQVAFGATVDCSGIHAGVPVPEVILVDQDGTVLASVAATPGIEIEASSTYTIPSSGVEAVAVGLRNNGTIFNPNAALGFSLPRLVVDSSLPIDYAEGPRWSPGGFAGQGVAAVEFSDDGGDTWTDDQGNDQIVGKVTLGAPLQRGVLTDAHVPFGRRRTYRSQVTVTL
jgi:hypothetical protein